jgi:deoxyribodipyrimidine photo-lyase
VITDDFPAFFLPHMVRAAAQKLTVRLERVDGNGMLPMAVTDRIFTTAYSFRRFLQKTLPPTCGNIRSASPFEENPLNSPVPVKKEILERWPSSSFRGLKKPPAPVLKRFPIDHTVYPVPGQGGRSR